MAIRFSIETQGSRSGNRHTDHSLVAEEIRHVTLPPGCGLVGFNIGGSTRGARGTMRMEIEEARMLAEMLLEGADIAERRDAAAEAGGCTGPIGCCAHGGRAER